MQVGFGWRLRRCNLQGIGGIGLQLVKTTRAGEFRPAESLLILPYFAHRELGPRWRPESLDLVGAQLLGLGVREGGSEDRRGKFQDITGWSFLAGLEI